MSQNSFNHVYPATVETNNFRQVLSHFNEEGHIISPNVARFAVACQICCKDLALINDHFDVHSRDSHEPYTVFPRCGHAFGYKCLYDWSQRRERRKRTMPRLQGRYFLSAKPHDDVRDVRHRRQRRAAQGHPRHPGDAEGSHVRGLRFGRRPGEARPVHIPRAGLRAAPHKLRRARAAAAAGRAAERHQAPAPGAGPARRRGAPAGGRGRAGRRGDGPELERAHREEV
ncbi:hypothetical protein F5X99DRAFT_372191 [Biscogniauxia marginata]|nr:hypothetical protein F5X99DRAFT_372191 [Biscogniauxia marginata]